MSKSTIKELQDIAASIQHKYPNFSFSEFEKEIYDIGYDQGYLEGFEEGYLIGSDQEYQKGVQDGQCIERGREMEE